ncbi:hypothetical protein ACTFIY_008975 [Dictyostelium cf. discoideum]
MIIIIFLIFLFFLSIWAIPPLNCQYEKQGYTLPPTTIYYLHNRGQIGKITRNDIKNNSTAINLFGSTNVSGRLSSVANNETILLSHGYIESYFDQDIFYIQRNIKSISSGIIDGWSYDFSYNETYEDIEYHIFDGSITFDDCSKDYFNVTENNDELKLSNLIIFDVKNRSSS